MAENEARDEILDGYESFREYSTDLLKSLVKTTKLSHDLSSSSEDFEFWSSFPVFSDFCDQQGDRMLSIISNLIIHQSIDCNWRHHSEQDDIDERFEALVDANDSMLEQVGLQLDELAGLSKNKKPILPPSIQQSKPMVSSWNVKKGEKSKNFHLLLAKNIQRPQMKWQDTVDNSNIPFMSPIQTKPNALRPLVKVISIEGDKSLDSTEAFLSNQRLDFSAELYEACHPYKYEIETFQLNDWQLKEKEEIKYKPLEDTQLTMIQTKEDLIAMIEEIKKFNELAIDLENHSYRSFLGFVCLMQLSTRYQDYIVDTLLLRREMHLLNEVFTDPAILKVLHGSDSDIEWLQRDFGLYIVNMFDTGQASRMLHLPRFSLSYLLDQYCNVNADKQFQLADWRIRPLPEEMVKYAREDTHYLLYVYDCLRNELIKRSNQSLNLLKSVYDHSKHITLKIFDKSRFFADSYMKTYLKYKRRFNPQQVKCFELLFKWRDNMARQEDESTGYVFPNHMMFRVAEILPKDAQGVLACCNPIPPLVKQNHNEIHRFVQQAKAFKLSDARGDPSTPISEKAALLTRCFAASLFIFYSTVAEIDLDNFSQCIRCILNNIKGSFNSTKVNQAMQSESESSHQKTQISTFRPSSSTQGEISPTKSGFDVYGISGPTIRVTSSLLSVFSTASQTRSKITLNDGLRKVEAIRSKLTSPFELLLPTVKNNTNDPQKVIEKWTNESMNEVNDKNKGTNNSKKRKKSNDDVVVIDDDDEDVGDGSSIRPKQAKQSPVQDIVTYEKAVKNPTDFVSFDYSDNDLKRFTTSKKTVDRAAEEMNAQSQKKDKNASRSSRVRSKFGNKTMTFKKK